MVGASKILTVSYGTFSCTLEGFEDSFGTMKAIAEYFRDLSAEDRYFGAEPPTPDAEMLQRIAEREVRRRVEARVEEAGIVLRAEDQPPLARPTSPAPAAPAPAETPAETNEPQAYAEPAPEDLPPAEDFARPASPAATGDSEAGSNRPAAASSPASDLGSVAAKLARIRAVVDNTRQAQGSGAYFADEEMSSNGSAALARQPVEDDQIDELIAEEAFEEPAIEPMPEDEPEAYAAPEQAVEDDDDADTEVADADAATDGQDLPDATEFLDLTPDFEFQGSPAAKDDDEDDRIDIFDPAEADEAAELSDEDYYENPADDGDDAEAAMVDDPEAGFAEDEAEAAPAAPKLAVVPPAPVEEEPDEEPDEIEIDDLRALDAAPEDDDEKDDITPARARVLKVARDALDEAEEDDAPSADGDDAQLLSPEDEAELEAELQAVRDEPVDAQDEPPMAMPRRHLPEDAGKPDRSVSRLVDEVNSKMEGHEHRRRRSAIQHLKAAVAATVADRKLSPAQREAATRAEQKPYREDLQEVVRPRSHEPSKTVAPLMLVSSQRVDEPSTKPKAEPVAVEPVAAPEPAPAPKPVEVPTPAAASASSESFEDFAARHEASSLSELLEAAAAYEIFVKGEAHFTRPQVIRAANDYLGPGQFEREDGLRAFGTLLREGPFQRIKRGQFTISKSSRYSQ